MQSDLKRSEGRLESRSRITCHPRVLSNDVYRIRTEFQRLGMAEWAPEETLKEPRAHASPLPIISIEAASLHADSNT